MPVSQAFGGHFIKVKLLPVYALHKCPAEVEVEFGEIHDLHGHYFRGELAVPMAKDRSFEFIEFQVAMQEKFGFLLQHENCSCEMYAALMAQSAVAWLIGHQVALDTTLSCDAEVWENDVVGATGSAYEVKPGEEEGADA